MRNPLAGFHRETSVAVTRQLRQNGETSSAMESPEKQNVTTDYEKAEFEKDPIWTESVSRRDRRKSLTSAEISTNFPKNGGVLDHWAYHSEELLAKEYPAQYNTPTR